MALLLPHIPGPFRNIPVTYCSKWPPVQATYIEIDEIPLGNDPILVYYPHGTKLFLLGFLPVTHTSIAFTFGQLSQNPNAIRATVTVRPEDTFYLVTVEPWMKNCQVEDLDLAQSIKDFWFAMACGGWYELGRANKEHCRKLMTERKMLYSNKAWRSRFLFAFHSILISYARHTIAQQVWFKTCYMGMAKVQLDDMATEIVLSKLDQAIDRAIAMANTKYGEDKDELRNMDAVVSDTIKFELSRFREAAENHHQNMNESPVIFSFENE